MRLCIIGASGKMGKHLCKLAKEDPEIELTSALCSPDSPFLGKDVGMTHFSRNWDLPFEKEPSAPIDVIIDLSTPAGLEKALSFNIPLVSGTTGLSPTLLQKLNSFALHTPLLYAPNFSLGMTHLFDLLTKLDSLKKNSTITISETHHTQKKDTPSGTALKLAELLDTDTITASRIPDVIGTHEIEFSLAGEKITLSHKAETREVFAIGAIRAAKYVFNKPPGKYSLSDCL